MPIFLMHNEFALFAIWQRLKVSRPGINRLALSILRLGSVYAKTLPQAPASELSSIYVLVPDLSLKAVIF